MSGKRYERPASAKRSIKHETFSPFASSQRLRQVQSLLCSASKSNSTIPDGLLCILGVDSRYNDGCTELANYLLFNFFELRREEFENAPFGEETIDDVVIMVRHDSVHVYCNPINYDYMLPYIAHWRNLHLHCLNQEQYEDEEKAEEFKIQSFVNMTADCRTIGVPYAGIAAKLVFEKMAVEKWPLVQGFALEGFGGGGFFTMKFEVVDVSSQLTKLYNMMDPVAFEHMLLQQLPQFAKQWGTMLSNIDLSKCLATMSGENISEPLRSYYKHGRAGGASAASNSGHHPFVLCGSNSSARGIESAERGDGATSTVALKTAGPNGQHALHMVCQAVAPRSPVSCMRTYFLSPGFTPYPLSTGMSPSDQTTVQDTKLLQQCYLACMEAVLTAIQVYSTTLSIKQAEHEVLRILGEQTDAAVQSVLANRRKLKFSIEAFDNQNGQIPVTEGEVSLCVKVVKLVVHDIPCTSSPGNSLGSVAFAEAFLHSALHVTHPDGSRSLDSDVIILTGHIPRCICWQVLESDRTIVEEVKSHMTPSSPVLGDVLISGQESHLLMPAYNHSFKDGETYVYSEGIMFTHQHTGSIVLPKTQVQNVQLYDGDSPSVVALLILTVTPDLWRHLPTYLRTDSSEVILAFVPKTKAYKALFSEVLSVWKDSENNALTMLEELPLHLAAIHSAVQTQFDNALSFKSPLRKAQKMHPTLDSFLQHYAVSSILLNQLVPSRDLNALLNQPSDAGGFDDPDEIVLTVVGGVPGSHKENLCTTITKLAKDENRWAVFRHPVDNIEGFNTSNLQHNLTAVLAANKRRKPGSKRKMRALILVPGFTDTVDVVQAITSHPDKDVASKLRIGAVTICIDQHNMYMANRYLLPKLATQCAQGWVNNIVFTGIQSQTAEALSQAQSLIRAVNGDVALLLAEKGAVTRPADMDLILSENAFHAGELVRARHMSCPGWTSGKFNSGSCKPEICEVLLKFSQPLDKNKLVNKLRGLKSIGESYQFEGKVYSVRGRLSFSDATQVYQLQYIPLSGYMDISPVELPPTPPSSNGNSKVAHSYCMVFSGCGLQEENLKTWMRSCAKQKPTKKVLRTRQSLTKTEIKKIHTEHHLESLPEGWFYNGSQYLSLAGDKSNMHPNLEQFLEDYIRTTNLEVEKYNGKIGDDQTPDLFA